MKKLYLSCFFFFCSLALFSQTKYTILKNSLLKADSVILIQCRNKQGYGIIDSVWLDKIDDSTLFRKGKILTVLQKKQLANIIGRPDHLNPKGKYVVMNSLDQLIQIRYKGKRYIIKIVSRKIILPESLGITSITIDVQKEVSLDNFFYEIGLRRQD